MGPRSEVINQVIQFVLPSLTDPADLSAASLVCTAWYEADRETREHVTVPLCYAAKPCGLSRRFPNLKSIRVKGRPLFEMSPRVPKSWGSFATPWVNEIAISKFSAVNSIRFKRIIITDLDLDVLSMALEKKLRTFELKSCSGFSSDGLFSVTKRCRKIECLLLSRITLVEEKNGEWLHQVALHNTTLKSLHCYQTAITKVSIEDLETIATKCSTSLVSLKISGFDLLRLQGTLRLASVLEEFYGGAIVEDGDPDDPYFNAAIYSFPPKMCHVGDFIGLSRKHVPIMYSFGRRLQTLDLFGAVLSNYSHCVILSLIPNIETLKTTTCIADEGLDVLSRYCKKLKVLLLRPASRHADLERYLVTDKGMIPVATNCVRLESLTVCMMKLGNGTLLAVAKHLKDLKKFDVQILLTVSTQVDKPLDVGIRAVLSRCDKLTKLRLYLERGSVRDFGMCSIGEYGSSLRSINLNFVGDSDEGLHGLAKGCKKLQCLELNKCLFSYRGIAIAVTMLPKLRYINVLAYESAEREDLNLMAHPHWRIEFCPSLVELVAYGSVADELSDYPSQVVRFN